MMQEDRGGWSGVVMRVSGRACATCTATAGHRGVEMGKRDIFTPRRGCGGSYGLGGGRRKNGLHGSGRRSVIGFSSFMGARLGELRSRVDLRGRLGDNGSKRGET
jgi:hypothetical protein